MIGPQCGRGQRVLAGPHGEEKGGGNELGRVGALTVGMGGSISKQVSQKLWGDCLLLVGCCSGVFERL